MGWDYIITNMAINNGRGGSINNGEASDYKNDLHQIDFKAEKNHYKNVCY